jgi:hypothetical protein
LAGAAALLAAGAGFLVAEASFFAGGIMSSWQIFWGGNLLTPVRSGPSIDWGIMPR